MVHAGDATVLLMSASTATVDTREYDTCYTTFSSALVSVYCTRTMCVCVTYGHEVLSLVEIKC